MIPCVLTAILIAKKWNMNIFIGRNTIVSSILFFMLLMLWRLLYGSFYDPTITDTAERLAYIFSIKIMLTIITFVWIYALTTYYTLIYALPNKRS